MKIYYFGVTKLIINYYYINTYLKKKVSEIWKYSLNYIKKNSELQIVVISFSDDFTKNSESLITTPFYITMTYKKCKFISNTKCYF